ncbi:hypothetical protein [Candidatus Marithrix sp. Canyon 246]|nr:hypothetical protein [Candidatus Marithrix sp. Canyon 246]
MTARTFLMPSKLGVVFTHSVASVTFSASFIRGWTCIVGGGAP